MVSTNTYLYSILIFTLSPAYSTISYKFEKYCDDDLTLPTSGRDSAIKLKFSNSFYSPKYCKIWVKTSPPNYYINFAFEKTKQYEISKSVFKRMILFTWTEKLSETVGSSSGLSPVLLEYFNDWVFSKGTIEVIATVFKIGNCTNDDFVCQNNYCISKALLYDGNNNCGDWSDEVYRFGKYGLSFVAKIGIVIGVILVCGILLAIIICVIRSKRSNVRASVVTIENSGVQYPKQYSQTPLHENVYYPPNYSQQQPVYPEPNYPPPVYSPTLFPPK